MSWPSSDSDKAKQTQEMHCSAGKRLKCSDPIPAENETDSLGLGKEVAANPERSCVRRFSSQPRTAPRASKQPGHIRTADTRCQNAIKQGTRPVSTPGITHQRRPAQTETLAGTDHGSRLPLTRIVPTFLFRPPSARQRRREKSGTGPSNPQPREEPFPGPTGPAPRVRAPRIPRKRLRPGSSEPEPAGAQYAPDTVFRAPCTARVIIGNHGARPRRDGLGCLTPAESSHLLDSDGRPTCQGRRSGEP